MYGVEAGYQATYATGIDGGWEHTFSLGFTTEHTMGSEVSASYTREQATEKRRTYAEMRAVETVESTEWEGATLSVTMTIENAGFIAYTIRNIVLTAFEIDYSSPDGRHNLCTSMTVDADSPLFETELRPRGTAQSTVRGLSFSGDITLDTASRLLRSTRNLVVTVASYQLVGSDGTSFVHDLTDVAARTASVVVDYGPGAGRDTERYAVAVGQSGSTLGTVLDDILQLPYATGEVPTDDASIVNFTTIRDRDATAPEAYGTGRWLTFHEHWVAGEPVADAYGAHRAISFDAITVMPQDTVFIMYVEDKDGDGFTAREEFGYGTSDTAADTDGDGTDDPTEIADGTDPLLADLEGEDWDDTEYTPDYTLNEVSELEISYLVEQSNREQDTIALDWEIPASPSGESGYMVVRRVGAAVEEAPSLMTPHSVGERYGTGASHEIVYIGGDTYFADGQIAFGEVYHYRVYSIWQTGSVLLGVSEGVGGYRASHRRLTFDVDEILVYIDNNGPGEPAELYWEFIVFDPPADQSLHLWDPVPEGAYQTIANRNRSDYEDGVGDDQTITIQGTPVTVYLDPNKSGGDSLWLRFHIIEHDTNGNDIVLCMTHYFAGGIEADGTPEWLNAMSELVATDWDDDGVLMTETSASGRPHEWDTWDLGGGPKNTVSGYNTATIENADFEIVAGNDSDSGDVPTWNFDSHGSVVRLSYSVAVD